MGHTPSGDPFQPVKIINYLCKHLCNKLKSIKTLFQRSLFLHRELWTTDCMTPLKYSWWLCTWHGYHSQRWGGGGGGVHVARLNFKTSRVGVYKCLSLIVGFAVTVAIWPREVVSCCDFILRAVATFWAMLLVTIYPGRASEVSKLFPDKNIISLTKFFNNFTNLSW